MCPFILPLQDNVHVVAGIETAKAAETVKALSDSNGVSTMMAAAGITVVPGALAGSLAWLC